MDTYIKTQIYTHAHTQLRIVCVIQYGYIVQMGKEWKRQHFFYALKNGSTIFWWYARIVVGFNVLFSRPCQWLHNLCLMEYQHSLFSLSLFVIYNVFSVRFATHLSSFNASSNPNPKESSLYIIVSFIAFALWAVYENENIYDQN